MVVGGQIIDLVPGTYSSAPLRKLSVKGCEEDNEWRDLVLSRSHTRCCQLSMNRPGRVDFIYIWGGVGERTTTEVQTHVIPKFSR